MSTRITETTSYKTIDTPLGTQHFSFDDLVTRLTRMERIPTLEEIKSLVLQVQIAPADLQPFLGFKAGGYSRHRVVRGEFAELLVLCWKPGQRTPIHDHNGSFGAVRVCDGVMWETIFALDIEHKLRYQTGRDWNPPAVTGADVPDIHQIGNPEVSGVDLVTLHLYAPPLGVLNTYRVGSSEIGHYNVDEFMDGAGI